MLLPHLQRTRAGPDASALIRLRGLAMDFDSHRILENVDLDLAPGGMVGLVGPNGAGKTTLLKLLMGLLTPTAGSIRLQGRCLRAFKRRELARLISLVPQDTHIGFAFSVEDIVAMGRNPHLGRFQVAGSHDLAQVRQAMEQTAIGELARRSVATLSGGERQRVLIARAIAQETPIVLLDEVTANLDLCHQLEVLTLARELAQAGRLVIAAIHDLNLAARYCDRLLLLAEQRIQADGPPRQVLTQTHLRRYFRVEAAVDERPVGLGLQITALHSAA